MFNVGHLGRNTNCQFLSDKKKDSRSEHREFPFWEEDIFYNEEFDPGSG